jgi:DNA-binding response OmpR family regulator
MRIGILEDIPEHAAQLQRLLADGGHSSCVYANRAQFFRHFAHESFDLLILDWTLPDASGIEVLEQLQGLSNKLPILFVTSRDAEEDVVTALKNGADDYIVKPPRGAELLARIDALQRRMGNPSSKQQQQLELAPYRFDLETRSVSIGDESVILSTRQFDLAVFLFRQPGRLFSRQHLLEAVWGVGNQIQTRTLDIHISQLRGLLRLTPDSGWRITSVYGYGYRLEPVANPL